MSADADGDGLRNLLEYFHGLNPTVADGPAPVAIDGIVDGWFHARYWRDPAATDVTAGVSWTTNLIARPWSDQGVVTEALGGEAQGWQRVRIPVGPDKSGGFLRLEVSE
jgi:hypothetical protein